MTRFCASHNPKVAGSNPAPAMQEPPLARGLLRLRGDETPAAAGRTISALWRGRWRSDATPHRVQPEAARSVKPGDGCVRARRLCVVAISEPEADAIESASDHTEASCTATAVSWSATQQDARAARRVQC